MSIGPGVQVIGLGLPPRANPTVLCSPQAAAGFFLSICLCAGQ